MIATLEVGRFVDPYTEIIPEPDEARRVASLADIGTFRSADLVQFLAGIRIADILSDTEARGWLGSVVGIRVADMSFDTPLPVLGEGVAPTSVVTAVWTCKKPDAIGFRQVSDEGLFLPAGFSGSMQRTPTRQFVPANVHGNHSARKLGMLPLFLRGFKPRPDIAVPKLPGRMPHIALGPVVARLIEVKRK